MRRVGRRAHPAQAIQVLGTVPARVVGRVDDLVAGRDARAEQLGHARDRLRAAVDDAIEIDDEQHARMVEA